MTQLGQSVAKTHEYDLPQPDTITIPWCPACHRSRFGRECIECGGKLVLQEFVHKGAYDALLERAR